MITAAVDIGTNTIKLTVASVTEAGEVRELHTDADTVRLGLNLANTGRIQADRMDATIATLIRWADVARSYGATELIGVATDATRKAANQQEFLARVGESGWEVAVIDGLQEAELTYIGLRATMHIPRDLVIVDVGGGSTEFIVIARGEVTGVTSLSLGSGTLTDAHIKTDPPTAAEQSALIHATQQIIQHEGPPVPDRVLAVGGTAEFAARLMGQTTRLTSDELDAAQRSSVAAPAASIAEQLGIQIARARVLFAGITIVREIALAARADGIEVAPSGLRTGVILHHLRPS